MRLTLTFAMASRVFIVDSFLLNGEEALFGTGEKSEEDEANYFQVELSSHLAVAEL